MENGVIISSIAVTGDWINVVDNNNRQISVWTGTKDNKTFNPNLKAALLVAGPGSEVEMKVVDKAGKFSGWEIDKNAGGGFKGKGFAPKDKTLEAYLSCLQSACTLFSLDKEKSELRVTQFAEYFYQEAMKHSTKPAQ